MYLYMCIFTCTKWTYASGILASRSSKKNVIQF